MATKFLRGLRFTTSGVDNSHYPSNCAYIFKFIYEFFGYCVNGTASLNTPGGMPATTPTGGFSTNYLEGTSVLASGSDGYTTLGSNVFTSASASFTSGMAGKFLVVWSTASNTAENSIYAINGVTSSKQLIVNVFSGGVPDTTTLHPTFTSRTGLNYRIIDIDAAITTGPTVGAYMVFNIAGGAVNTGAATSQFQLILSSDGGLNDEVSFVLSPAGTWNGTTFSDGSTIQTSRSFYQNGNATAFLVMIADPTFLLLHTITLGSGNPGSILHIEAPVRIYPQASDPNPLTGMVYTNGFTTNDTLTSYGGGFVMIGQDLVTRNMRTLVPSLSGDGFTSGMTLGNGNVFGQNFNDPRIGFNTISNFILSTDGILSCVGVGGQYNLSRAKLRNVRFIGTFLPNYSRFGTNGQYIYLTNGIAWPWDNTILPYNLMQGGF